MLAAFMPGIVELIILGVILLVPIAIIVVVVIGVTKGSARSPANPNLSTCPACGNTFSIHAESCPQCGRPMKVSD